MTIRGVVRASRATADLSGATDPPLQPGQSRLDTWIFPNIPRLQGQVTHPLLPIYIQLAPVAGDSEPPIASQPDLEFGEGPHQGYAIQWFSFAVILIIGYHTDITE